MNHLFLFLYKMIRSHITQYFAIDGVAISVNVFVQFLTSIFSLYHYLCAYYESFGMRFLFIFFLAFLTSLWMYRLVSVHVCINLYCKIGLRLCWRNLTISEVFQYNEENLTNFSDSSAKFQTRPKLKLTQTLYSNYSKNSDWSNKITIIFIKRCYVSYKN